MAFGEFLAISPSQILAAEAEQKRREQEAEQFAIKMRELAQERAAKREADLAAGAWERQKWGVEQGWKGKAADWQAGEPGRKEAFEVFKKGLEPTQAEKISLLMEEEGVRNAAKGVWLDQPDGSQINSISKEIRWPNKPTTWETKSDNPLYQVSSGGKQELISTPTPEPEVWWEDSSRPGWQISNRGGERVRQETGEEQTARKLKELAGERAGISEIATTGGLGLESITGGGVTYKKPTPEPIIPEGFIPKRVTAGKTTYEPPTPEKPITRKELSEQRKAVAEVSKLIDSGEIEDIPKLQNQIGLRGFDPNDPAFAALYKRIPEQTEKKSFWSSRLGEAIKPGRAKKPTLSEQYQSGETRTIGGVTYKRNAQGQWLPVS